MHFQRLRFHDDAIDIALDQITITLRRRRRWPQLRLLVVRVVHGRALGERRLNAYDGSLIEGLLGAMDALRDTASLRAVVVSGTGKHFQAGATSTGSTRCAAPRPTTTCAP